MKIIFAIVVIFLSASCSEVASETFEESNLSNKEITDTIDRNMSFRLSELPKSRITALQREHSCYDVYDNQRIELPKNLRNSGLSYYSYSFDTIVNNTRLIYSYRIIGTEDDSSSQIRLLSNIQNHFEAMAESAEVEPRENNCLYAQLTDSLSLKNGKLLYTRYEGFTVGGAGAIESSIKYSLTISELKETFNQAKKIVNSSKLEKYLISEKYY